MKKFAHLTILVAATALAVAPLAMAMPAQAATSAPVAVAPAAAKAATSAPKLNSKLIKSMKSKDHTIVTGKIKIAPLIEPSATVWTSTRHSVSTVIAWEIRDLAGRGDRVRVCSDDPSITGNDCRIYRLAESRGVRLGVVIQETRTGWNVFARPDYDSRSTRECRSEGIRGDLVTWSIDVIAGGRIVATSESSWRLRCVR